MKVEPSLCHWLLLWSLLGSSYADDHSSPCLLCPAVPSSSSALPVAPAGLLAHRTSPELLLSALLHIRRSRCWNTAQMAQNSCKDQPKVVFVGYPSFVQPVERPPHFTGTSPRREVALSARGLC